MKTQGQRAALRAAGMLLTLFAAAAQAGTLTGRVSDGSGSQALVGAEITLVEANRRAVVGADGRFQFGDLPAGRYTLLARYVGAADVQQTVEVTATGITQADLLLGSKTTKVLDSVLVVGQRANQASALSRQRAADGVQSVLTRDAIGQFPDQNVAEAVRRAPGVNVLNDQGEGRFIAVRGLDPNLNAASINGVRVPSPEADIRAVALDVLPAELIESIEIKKSLTPDMDGDTLGASIEINTPNAFARKQPYAALSVEGSYNDLNGETSPKAALDFSRRLTDDLGVAGGLSYYQRKFATDNIEADGWAESGDGIVYAEDVEYRDYDVERTRIGASLSLDYRASEHSVLSARAVHSVFEDDESRARLIFGFDAEPNTGDASSAQFSSDDGAITIERDIKDRYERQTITTLALGSKTVLDAWRFDTLFSHALAREKEDRGSLDPLVFAREFEEPGELDVRFNYSDFEMPRFAIGPNGADVFADASEYEFDQLERTAQSDSRDRENALKLDVARRFDLASGSVELKAGGKYRERSKTFNLELEVFDGFDGDFTLADVAGSASYGLANLGTVPDAGRTRAFFNANRAAFELNPLDTAFESNVADYRVDEDILAGYFLGRYEFGALRAIAGARVERTENRLSGNIVELVEEGGMRNGVVLGEDTLFISGRSVQRDYTDVLPSVNLRYEARPDFIVRAAAYQSLLRPGIGQIAPRFLVEENDEGEREGEFGNPDLQPYQAVNADLGAEWYFARNGVVQAGVFYKEVEDFIVNAVFEDITFNGIAASEAIIPINGETATVRGLEFNYQQALDFLPGLFNGLLLGLNYTYTDTEGRIDGRDIPLPAASKNTGNATLGYEKGPVSLRVAAAYRSSYLDELGGDAETDRYVKDHLQLDFSAKYRLTPNLQVFGELVNLTDEPFVAFQRGPGRDRVLQYEEYSYTAKFGLRANF